MLYIKLAIGQACCHMSILLPIKLATSQACYVLDLLQVKPDMGQIC